MSNYSPKHLDGVEGFCPASLTEVVEALAMISDISSDTLGKIAMAGVCDEVVDESDVRDAAVACFVGTIVAAESALSYFDADFVERHFEDLNEVIKAKAAAARAKKHSADELINALDSLIASLEKLEQEA